MTRDEALELIKPWLRWKASEGNCPDTVLHECKNHEEQPRFGGRITLGQLKAAVKALYGDEFPE